MVTTKTIALTPVRLRSCAENGLLLLSAQVSVLLFLGRRETDLYLSKQRKECLDKRVIAKSASPLLTQSLNSDKSPCSAKMLRTLSNSPE